MATNSAGRFRPTWGNLTDLKEMRLDDNDLTGAIPELGSLSNLRQLSLAENALTGAIPAGLGALADLRELRLDNNRLTGVIPTEFGAMTSLRELGLSENMLTGAVPPELSAIANLRTLRLAGNLFSGCLPQALYDVSNSDLARDWAAPLRMRQCQVRQLARGLPVSHGTETIVSTDNGPLASSQIEAPMAVDGLCPGISPQPRQKRLPRWPGLRTWCRPRLSVPAVTER